MLAPWIGQELRTTALGDRRLNERLQEILDQLSKHPTASIPSACGGYAETTAAYRFFDNDRVTFAEVLRPHIDATWERIEQQTFVLLVQDTTECDVTRPEHQVRGAGPLDRGTRRGGLLHLLHAFTPDGTPLGTAHAVPWSRAEDARSCSQMSSWQRVATPLEEKESYRWVETLRQAQRAAALRPQTKFVCLADSEADIYEFLVAGLSEPRSVDWIVRACHDRLVQHDGVVHSEELDAAASDAVLHGRLREEVLAAPVLFTQTIQVRGRKTKYHCDRRGRRQPRQSRAAQVEIRAAKVALRPPRRPQARLPVIAVNVVLVREVDPPEGEEAVEWILLTSLPIDTLEQVRQVIQAYCVRWLIEVFFRTLKSGCRIEERRFEDIERFWRALAVYLIVTWRTLFVCRIGREFPDINCEAVFEPSEWQSAYQIVHRQPPPSTPPCLGDMVRLVAQLGGYVNRKRPDPPGPQTVWRGLERLHDMALCWQVFGPGAQAVGAVV